MRAAEPKRNMQSEKQNTMSNQFVLGERSTEQFVSPQQAPLFASAHIRLAGITHAVDEYLCARKSTGHHTILITLEGQGQLICNQEKMTLHEAQLCVLPKGVDFCYQKMDSAWRFIWFIVEDCSAWPLNNTQALIWPLDSYKILQHSLQLLALAINPMTAAQLAKDVVATLASVFNKVNVNHAGSSEVRLQKMFSEVEQQIHVRWTVALLAKKMHCSEPTLHRMCLKQFTHSPMQQVIDLRIKRACFLLINSDWTLNNIAQQVGYKDAFNLSKIFKKKLNVCPSQWRELEMVKMCSQP